MVPGRSFELYDLRVIVDPPQDGSPILCNASAGDYFDLRGEVILFPKGQGWSIYSLGALLALLPAKQRARSPGDWMTREDVIACPDPACKSTLRIVRTGISTFTQDDNGLVRVTNYEPIPQK